MSPWNPITNVLDLKHLGKLGEELGECSAAVSRCTIQGIDEVEPDTLKPNRQWLMEEIADVLAGIDLCVEHFDLDLTAITARKERKKVGLRIWHGMPTQGGTS